MVQILLGVTTGSSRVVVGATVGALRDLRLNMTVSPKMFDYQKAYDFL